MKTSAPQNPAPWDTAPFLECLGDLGIVKPGKLLARDYKPKGPIPVVDQGQQLIAGWTAEETLAVRENLPFIVFGDHTRAFKFVNFPFALGADGTHLLKPAEGFNPHFFYYACLHLPLPNRGYNRHFTVLKEQALPKPPKPEQEKIAAVLWKIQHAIEVEERLLATARELKHSAMRQLFSHGLRYEPQKETELGPVPRSWETAKLAELLEIKHGYAFKGAFFASAGKHILLTPGHFLEEGGFRDQKAKTKYYTGDFPAEYMLHQEDLLVAMTEQTSGLLGSAVLIPESDKFLHNQRLGLIANLKEARLHKPFLYYWFSRPEVRNQIEQTATGSKVRHTSPGRIRDLTIALPVHADQREIASILQTIDRKITIHGRKRDALRDLFQTLLHQLMTAQIRVDKLDIDTREVVS